MGNWVYYGNTDRGRVRPQNEDCFHVGKIWDDGHILAVVADGLGGYEGGEIAAALARDGIVAYLENSPNGERLELLRQAVAAANNAVYSERLSSPRYGRMGCVLTAALVETEQRRVNMCHVGDTRLYRYCGGGLQKLSHDHSVVGYREEIGELTEEQAMKHPQRNVISKDIGSKLLDGGNSGYIDAETFDLPAGAALLLCSDGLYDMIDSVRIREVLGRSCPVGDKVRALIDAANEAGGRDNVTVVLIGEEEDGAGIPVPPAGRPPEGSVLAERVPEGSILAERVSEGSVSGKDGPPSASLSEKGRSRRRNVLRPLLIFALGFLLGWLASRFFHRPAAAPAESPAPSAAADSSSVISSSEDTLRFR